MALDAAYPGDTITLTAGATYRGNFTLRANGGTGWITIRSSASDSLPASARVTPAQAAYMAALESSNTGSVLNTDFGAHNYRFVGIEFRTMPGVYGYDVIMLGNGNETATTQLPYSLEFDRTYIHGDAIQGGKRGIALNCRDVVIKNSYFANFKSAGQETQAIAGWSGPGPYQIINNYIEAAGIGILFGGATPWIANTTPSDIEVRQNYFFKPLSWREGSSVYAGTRWTVKNHLELKNARRVQITGNIFEQNWVQADQAGFSLVFTVRTENGAAAWAVVEDINVTANIIRKSGAGINILGVDDNGLGKTHRVKIENNLFEDIGQAWGADGRLFQVLTFAEDVSINHNTAFHDGTVIMFDGPQSQRIDYLNNITKNNTYGIFGSGVGSGIAALVTYDLGGTVTNNVLAGGTASGYPLGNFYPATLSDVGFVNLTQRDYHLTSTSPYHLAGTDGKDLGADIDLILSATSGVLQGGIAVQSAVLVGVTPGSATLQAGATQQFSAMVTGSADTSVTWSLQPAIGTVSSTGLYTAPSTLTSQQSVTLTATSTADPSKSAAATITLNPAVAVSLTPGTVSLGANAIQQFNASVIGTTNTGVGWTFQPQVGTLSTSGLYQAPANIASAQTIIITATSAADGTKSASATVSLTPTVAVSVTPGTVSLAANASQQFNASVTGTANTAVTWTVQPQVGTISASGVYQAPASIASTQTLTIKATSAADGTKTGSATLSLAPTVAVSVTPGSVSLGANGTQQFSASVTGTANTGVVWSVQPQVGTISASGVYQAPASITSAQTVTVKATSAADGTKSASAIVSLTPTIAISVTPGSVSLGANGTQQFSASVTGTANTAVTWTVEPSVGSISPAGLYQAPANITSAQTLTIKATSAADGTKTGAATVTLSPPVVAVGLSPTSVSLQAGSMQQFTATITGSANTAVTWTMQPQVGTLSSTGLYRAPASVTATQTVTITVTSAADPTKSATAIVTLLATPITIAISPNNVVLRDGGTKVFAAKVTGTADTAVTWSLSSPIGTITQGGLYTAPATVTQRTTIRVIATLVANPAITAEATVQLK